jgi:cell division protein FtsA
MTDYLVAIDLGTTKIVSIVGEEIKDSRQIRILAYGEAPSEGIRHGQVENIQNVVDVIKNTLEQIKNRTAISTVSEVYVGIAGMHIRYVENRKTIFRSRYEELITENEIKQLGADACRMYLNSGERIIHAIPQTYSIDDVDGITDPVGRLGNKLSGNFMVVIEQGISTKHTEICIKRLNFRLKELILEPMASARAVLCEEEKDMGVAMVDIGGGTSDLIIYKDKTVKHTAIIPLGGNSVTQDIKMGCRITLREAENLKIRCGSCVASMVSKDEISIIPGINGRESREISLHFLAYIIEMRMTEIISMILSHIGECSEKLAAGIVLTGGGSKMKHLQELVKLSTGLDVRIGQPSPVSVMCPKELLHPKYSTAVGLVMCGFDIKNGTASEDRRNNTDNTGTGRDADGNNTDSTGSGRDADGSNTDSTGSGREDVGTRQESKISVKDMLKKIFYTDGTEEA